MLWPNGSRSLPPISSAFGPRRSPGSGGSSQHRGTDFVGFSTVRAVAPGTVRVTGTPGGWTGGGRQVWIQHDGFFSRSMHLSSIGVRDGQRVGEGEAIGVMGATGTATGVHLHLEITPGNLHHSNSGQVDPVAFIRARLGTGRLAVDGIFGRASIGALQRALGVTADGIMGPVTKKALQKALGVVADGIIGPQTTRALQRMLGVTADGAWGPATTRALQEHLRKGLRIVAATVTA